MRKARRSLIVLILGALTGVMAFGVVGSAAWFTDQDSIVGNTVGSGTFSIDVIQDGGVAQPFQVSNLAPGGPWTAAKGFGIYNDGSLNALYSIGVDNVVETETGMADLINVRLIPYFGGGFNTNCTGATYEGPLTTLAGNTSQHPFGPLLQVNWTHPWKVCFMLDGSAGNEYQNETVTFDIVVNATQPEAP